MNAGVRIGTILGIPVRLHLSWLLIFGLLTWSLAAGYFPEEYSELAPSINWTLGIITSLLFFLSVLAHELGHAIVAQRNNIHVKSITLFIFGGLAQIIREPQDPGQEFRIAAAGPLVSFLLAGLFYALYLLDQSIDWLAAPSIWLARINLLLALFNLIPGFPLDGGRMLRAAVWRSTGDLKRATQIATTVGQLSAFAIIVVGISVAVTGDLFDGLWLVFIGWFLQNASTTTLAQSNTQDILSGLRVSQVMAIEWPTLASKLPLNRLVEEKILRGGPRYYFIERDGYGEEEKSGCPKGMLSLTNVMAIPQSQWAFTPVDKIMVPWDELIVTTPDTPIIQAVQLMDEANVAQLPVLEEGQLVGILAREQIIRHLRLRAELRMGIKRG